jgi:hypothetical protein
MNTRTIAFLTRSLRQECRLISHHVMRGGLAALILFIFGTYLASMATQVGAGGRFASSVLYCCYVFLTLVGGLYFSVSIVEEKEEQTLPLLRMTGATPLTILLGKSIPRLMVALLFVLIITPFLVLSLTLGGVLIWGLISSVMGLLTYAIMLSQLGTLASVFCRQARSAFVMTMFAWLLLEVPLVWAWPLDELTANQFDIYGWFAERSLMTNMSYYLTSWASTEIWWPQMTFHLALAGACLLISRLVFERFTAGAVAGTDGEESGLGLGRQGSERKAAARVPQDSLQWKSWKYVSGGWPWFLVRIVVPPLLTVTLMVTTSTGRVTLEDIGIGMWIVGIVIALINVANLLGNVFNAEIRGNTFSGLLMLPQSPGLLAARMLAGLVPAVISSVGCLGLGLLILFLDGELRIDDVLELLAEPAFLHCATWLAATLMLGLVLSVRMRYGGMLLATVLCGFLIPFVFMSCFSGVFFLSGNDIDEIALFAALMLFETLFCFWMWRQLITDIEHHGAAS